MAAVKRKEQMYVGNLPLEEEQFKRRKVRRKKAKKSKAKGKLKMVASMALALTVTLFLLGRYAEISKVKYEILDLEGKIEKTNTYKDELNIELEEIKDSDWFVLEAQGRVNLRKAEEGQFVEIKVPAPSEAKPAK